MKNKTLLILIGIFTLFFVSACGNSSNDTFQEEDLDNVNKSDMPIVEDEITLDIFVGQTAATADDWNDVLIFNEYKKMTNVNAEFNMVPYDAVKEQRNLAISSGTLPDAFHSAGIPNSDLYKYGEQGMFIPLNDLIEEYGPNLKKVFEEHPEVEKALTHPDGNIYSYPTLYDPDFKPLLASSEPWFREDWLEKLDMDIPETTDEYYEFLKAVKETDLIGDGSNREVPFGAQGEKQIFDWLKGSFGVGNRGLSVGNVDADPEDESKVRFFPITDGYKEMLEYTHKLFAEELIEQNIFSQEHEQYFANAAEGLYASTYIQNPADLFGGEHKDSYTGGFALEGPNGEKSYNGMTHPVGVQGSFVITKENKNPVATVRWIDHFYGDEGAKLYMMGIEGETYEVTEDGEYEFVDKIRNNPDGLNLDQSIAKYLTWPGGMYPAIVKPDYFKGAEGSEAAKVAFAKLEPDAIEEVWPAFTFTEEENKKMASFGADINKYVSEMTDKFVKGDISFDKWDEYVKTLEDMNLEEYLEIQQAAYERYENN